MHFQLLSGIKLGYQPKLYGYVFFTMMSFVTMIALASSNMKKIGERYKDRKFHGKINMNLNTRQVAIIKIWNPKTALRRKKF